MGGRSKFSFPIPGRKHTKETKPRRVPQSPVSVTSTSGLSKAQRLLGTDGDLNIDSPTWDDFAARSDDQSWRSGRPRSSGMSISVVSESTQGSESGQDRWEQESGVLPRPRMHNKASSTFLGQHYNDDAGTDTSSLSRRVRNQDSSSTLRSHYDRQKSPLAISQQTSESSARDLALRKGYPPITQQQYPRSPMLQTDNSDPFHERFSDSLAGEPLEDDKSRKKPARLDLSRLFAKSKELTSGAVSPSASSLKTNGSGLPPLSSRRKLNKALSKESLQSQRHSIRSDYTTQSAPLRAEDFPLPKRSESFSTNAKNRETHGTLYQLYDHYEQLPMRSPYMSQIPESRVADGPEIGLRRPHQHPAPMPTPPKSRDSRANQEPQSIPGKEAFSWKNVRNSMASSTASPAYANSSAASISSRTSKTSRHTSTSMFESNLQQNSVLSLSSDSESDDGTDNSSHISLPARNPLRNSIAQTQNMPVAQRPRQLSKASDTSKSSQNTKPPSRTASKSPAHRAPTHNKPLAIPELKISAATPTPPRKSGPGTDAERQGSSRQGSSGQRQKPSKKASSIASITSQPTPPLSPSSIEMQSSSARSSRYMAVTKQEEALLEALRQKRAKMREKIIKEHERVRTPPEAKQQERSRSRISETSSASTVRGNSANRPKEEILLYLNTPVADGRAIDAPEPSPDLSDFLSFGSDDETTPRSSLIYAPSSRGQPRPDSSVSPNPNERANASFSPMTPPTTVRLSAVGSTTGFPDYRKEQKTKTKNGNSGVRFVDDINLQQGFSESEHHPELIWGISGHA
ncbi:hypothetical protein BP6252_00744 [Coleophoma cylindrospora]|uniref:Uncharacterized protein n=1 Tax=Coleophoma cylindrospora TaxID=1849047 RepID=A0A3D8SQZ4_9HELO|nr:hypothetical protein BP6252_00744 [Coleophoma cylindrospora]